MSTRSYICKENEDGTITGSYCHCDGYLTYNGAMLIDHYNTQERVDKLLSLGNMSCLNPIIEPDPSKPHTFDDRQPDVTVFYGRDRGEKGQEAQTVKLEDLDDPSSWSEYCYVYGKDGLKGLQQGLDEEYPKLGFPGPDGDYGFFTQGDITKRRYDYEKSHQA